MRGRVSCFVNVCCFLNLIGSLTKKRSWVSRFVNVYCFRKIDLMFKKLSHYVAFGLLNHTMASNSNALQLDIMPLRSVHQIERSMRKINKELCVRWINNCFTNISWHRKALWDQEYWIHHWLSQSLVWVLNSIPRQRSQPEPSLVCKLAQGWQYL